jgi:hypothetical protein
VPAESYSYSSNTGDVLTHLQRVMSYVRDAHPWFNVTGVSRVCVACTHVRTCL